MEELNHAKEPQASFCLPVFLLAAVVCSPKDASRGRLQSEHLILEWEKDKLTLRPSAGGQSWSFNLAENLRAAINPPGYYYQEWTIDFGYQEQPDWYSPGPKLECIEQPEHKVLRYRYSLQNTGFTVSFRLLEDAPELEVVISADTSGEVVVTDIEAPGQCRPELGEITTFLLPYMQGIIWRRNLEASFIQPFRTNKRVVGLSMPFYLVRSGTDWIYALLPHPPPVSFGFASS